ncbi:MAG TPA: DoxX family protein [Bryobacteraceae bacterium]|nr:DoxX family protein [Bryobacteraceae bacterium]
MIPFVVLVVAFCICALTGKLGNAYLADYHHALRPALAVMFLLTASAHWGAKRADLVRMVPSAFGRTEAWVTLTGLLEIAGAIGLLIPVTAPAAAIGLALLLLAMFPANVRAARLHLTIGGKQVPKIGIRAVIQVIFLTCAVLATGL